MMQLQIVLSVMLRYKLRGFTTQECQRHGNGGKWLARDCMMPSGFAL
ncbi:hypothetical protein AEAC466_19250 [Asticcacaulis sp. AC466]|nr:hypothetical protein AEAC466_19250 [Asticcacaulis sp. AC466]